MPFFDYTASDREGNLSHGQIEATDRMTASKLLSQSGLFVMGVTIATKPALPKVEFPPTERVAPDPEELLRQKLEALSTDSDKTVAVATVKKSLSLPQRSWSAMDRALYLRQLQVMFEAGIPLYRAASILAESKEYNPFVQAKLKEIPLDLERGRLLSKAIERSALFTPLIISSVKLGEESGRLDDILDALSEGEEKAVHLKKTLVSRLTYPAVVLAAMCGGMLVLGHVMSRAMASLPAFQEKASPILGLITGVFQSAAFFPLLFLLLALSWMGGRKLLRRHRSRLVIESALLSTPAIGPLIRRIEANSVASHLSLLLKAGLAIDRGLGLSADLARTLSFRRALLLTQQQIRDGEELAASLKASHLFPYDMIALVESGEQSGSLEESLETAARYCADQVERSLDAALSVLEPVLIGILGIAIGAVLILTFVPIFSTLEQL